MFRIISLGARVFAPRFLYLFRMSQNGEQVYYAVGRGREVGIYNSWSECKAQIDGVANAKYRKFFSLPEAEEFVNFWKDYSSPHKNVKVENSVSKFSKSEDNFRKGRDGGSDTPKKLFALGDENTLEQRNSVGLQPYISPIPLPLQSQFRNKVKIFQKSEVKSSPEPLQCQINSTKMNAFKKTDVGLATKEILSNPSSCSFTTVELVRNIEVPSQIKGNTSVNVASEPFIKQEVVQKYEDVSGMCNKPPKGLKPLESAVKGFSRENLDPSEKIRSTLKQSLEKICQTNSNINPQMESEENNKDFEESKTLEQLEVQTQESMPGQEQTSVSPSTVITSPPEKCFGQKDVEVLALNLRLDSFEKRFDACLKEFGTIASEISHIKSEIKEIKDILGQGSSFSSSTKKKDGLLQTTLNFDSPSKFESSRFDCSSRAYSTDQGATNKEGESEEYKSSRKKRRRLSRSESTGDTKRFAEDKNDGILSRIKTEEVEYTSFCLDKNEFVEVYTDGACHYNGEREAKAGIGIWFGDSHPLNVSEPVIGTATNNEAEIQAARIAIELAVKAGVKKLKILTDSEFLINCVTKWMHRWKRNGWTLMKGGTVKNRKELEKLDRAASQINVRWEKVLAHSGIKGNEMADKLANQGAEKYVR